MGEAGFEPAAPCVLDKRSDRAELLAHVSVVQFRDKGSNLGLHVQSVVSCRLDDPGMSLLGYGTFGASRTMLFKPLACPSTLDRGIAASYVEGIWSPALLPLLEMRRQKQRLIKQRNSACAKRRRTFLS